MSALSYNDAPSAGSPVMVSAAGLPRILMGVTASWRPLAAGLVLLMTSAGVQAYGGWTVTNGVIAAPCPTGALSCGQTIQDNGFLMRKVTPGLGAAPYYQYIMTALDATGSPDVSPFAANGLGFANETIALANNTPNNFSGTTISQKTLIAESWLRPDNTEDRWSLVATAAGGMGVTLDQQVSQIDWSQGVAAPIELMSSRFRAKGLVAGGGGGVFFDLILTGSVNLGGSGVQKFQWQKDLQTGVTHTAGTGTPVLPGGSNGGDFTIYALGGVANQLYATWIGQTRTDTPAPAAFGQTAYTYYGTGYINGALTSVVNETRLTSLDSANPPSNINSYFAPNTFFNEAPDIAAPPAPIVQTAWVTPTDRAAARNDHVATPLALPSSGTGAGGPPMAMNDWTVTNGIITPGPCPLNMTCGETIAYDGFLQRAVYAADGTKYLQLIITDKNATGDPKVYPAVTTAAKAGETIALNPTWSVIIPPGPGPYPTPLVPARQPFVPGLLTFANETFIRPGSEGIANSMKLAAFTESAGTWHWITNYLGAPTYNYRLDYDSYIFSGGVQPLAISTVLNNGWAQGAGATPTLQIKQVLGLDGDPNGGARASNLFLGYKDGSQFDLTMAANGAKDYSFFAVTPRGQGQYFRVIEGGVQTTRHSAQTDPILVAGGTNGGTIDWLAGDSLSVLWWGGNSSGIYGVPGTGGSGFLSYTNLTTGERTSYSSTSRLKTPLVNPRDPAPLSDPPSSWAAPFNLPAPPAGSAFAWPGQNLSW
ncbi:MAG: hypothetical protein HY940_01565 [Gammaproteobacteria bacterium]|nr:hypothetical protein [Gammaproteobacteria bacterium]